jgi:signal transduction histidine kinase
MINLPEHIISYMAARSLSFENPAFIEVETDGTIISWGGNLQRFELNQIEINKNIGQFIDVFEGFFPFFVDEIELPLVEISPGVYSDIYIFRLGDKINVLFIDSSKSGESIQNFYQNRNEKMLFADSQLSFKEDPALFLLFKSLDTVVMEKIDDDTFQLMGKAPSWVTSLNPNDKGIVQKEQLFTRYPFIENFLQTAMEFWKKNNTGMFPSDIWSEIDGNNEEYYMDAKAISLLTRKFLLLQHSHGAAQEKFKLIQRARELSLEHELRIKAEQQLNIKNEKLKELNATKDKFFSIIAHDLRNPIGAFRNLVELFSFYYDTMSSDEIQKTIELLEKQTIVLHRLLDNLLHWSRTQMEVIQFNPVETEFFGMSESIISLYSFSAKEKGIELINSVPRDTILQCDQDLLSVVLRNLISNSIKFTEKGGKVEILLKQDERGAKVTIRDTGIGMSPDDLDKLFKIEENYTRYGTSNEKGTGLGLILCKEFIEMHGGTLHVESELGKGSKFCFTIPKQEKE